MTETTPQAAEAAEDKKTTEEQPTAPKRKMYIIIAVCVCVLILGAAIFAYGYVNSQPRSAYAQFVAEPVAEQAAADHWQRGPEKAANAVALVRLGLVNWDENNVRSKGWLDLAADGAEAQQLAIKLSGVSAEEFAGLLESEAKPTEYGMAEFCAALQAAAECNGAVVPVNAYQPWAAAGLTYQNVADAVYFTLCLPVKNSSLAGVLLAAEVLAEKEAVLADLPVAGNTAEKYQAYFVESLLNDARPFVYTKRNLELLLAMMDDRSSLFALINQMHTLAADFVPQLVDTEILPAKRGPEYVKLRPDVYAEMQKLFAAALADEIVLYARSGYRDYEFQKRIYGNGQNPLRAAPGASEHQTGLAMDIVNKLNVLDTALADCEEAHWLAENSHLHGFVVRYTPEKEAITGYPAEWWHVRYLGLSIAGELTRREMCYEEYYEFCRALLDA